MSDTRFGIVVCEHGCGICGQEWKHVPSAHGGVCRDAGKVNRICPPCDGQPQGRKVNEMAIKLYKYQVEKARNSESRTR